MTALCAWGPCPEHRYSYTNVLQANRRWATGWQGEAADLEAVPSADDDLPGVAVPSADDDLPGVAVRSAYDDLPGVAAAPASGPAGELALGKLALGNGTETPDAWADLVAEEAAAAEASRAIPVWADAPGGGE
jgi:hypothetical protein